MSDTNAEKKQSFKFRPIDIALIAMFVALITVCSWASIPIGAVPVTLQTFAVFVTVSLLGGFRGTIAILVYILIGAIGVPVFAKFGAGVGVLLGQTGGYIIGFVASGLIMWGFEKLKYGRKIWMRAIAMVLGLAACYAIGTVWFMQVYTATKGPVELATVLGWCVTPFIIPDIVKIVLALIIGSNRQLRKLLRNID